jgi:hypothetical protein
MDSKPKFAIIGHISRSEKDTRKFALGREEVIHFRGE